MINFDLYILLIENLESERTIPSSGSFPRMSITAEARPGKARSREISLGLLQMGQWSKYSNHRCFFAGCALSGSCVMWMSLLALNSRPVYHLILNSNSQFFIFLASYTSSVSAQCFAVILHSFFFSFPLFLSLSFFLIYLCIYFPCFFPL